MIEVLPGVWRCTIGSPETITPERTRATRPAVQALNAMARVDDCPVTAHLAVSERGVLVSVPLAPAERIYGLGLQLQSFEHRGAKKRLRVNADPAMDTGDSHAPVPFYVTTRGYGVFVDTARYATFYLGNKTPPPAEARVTGEESDGWNGVPPYVQRGIGEPSEVLIEVPQARGVDVYIFAGPSLGEAVQRYNLFAGGGVVPPRWGLGCWYRAGTDASAGDVLALAAEFRERQLPCDVLGLEPHWQSHSYSSSFTWSARFPDPAGTVAQLASQHYRVNLWEQAFVHPTSPMYAALRAHSGDYAVWGGLVPDFLSVEARKIFADHHATLIDLGVSGFKADECDNSDFTGNWSFPEISRFPSGADGEQMHALFGLRYQDALQEAFSARHQRTYGMVRSSGALAAPYPYVLYSDLYDHRQFVRAVAQAGFSGLLWTPEVREAISGVPELVRRLQAVAFSPLAIINGWYLQHPPWKQVQPAANRQGQFAPNWEQAESLCRAVLELRMKFVPYLHAAFVRYQREGLPPFRALVMDYPDDPNVVAIDDQYLMGDDLLVAPVIADESSPADSSGETQREVYLPTGQWHDFWTGAVIAGPRRVTLTVPLDRIPLFVKSGAVLPLAQPTQHTDDPASRRLTAHVFGDGARGARLYEDDGSFQPALTELRLTWDAATRTGTLTRAAQPSDPAMAPLYSVVDWKLRT